MALELVRHGTRGDHAAHGAVRLAAQTERLSADRRVDAAGQKQVNRQAGPLFDGRRHVVQIDRVRGMDDDSPAQPYQLKVAIQRDAVAFEPRIAQ